MHVKHIHLLPKLYGKVFIPLTVALELNTLVAFGYDISFLEMSEVYEIRPSTSSFFIQKLSEFLDPGEAEAIALAKELGADLLLIDERIGRRFAEAEQIACKGVVGILIEAKKEGFIQLLKPLLDDLVENLKFRLSHHIYKLALQRQTNSISK